jgi:hypothetical protein
MRFKSTWILAILLVAIAAYYFLVEERRKEADERRSKMSRRIFPYGREEIDRFVLINPQGDRIEIEKTYTGWKIISPVVTEASPAMIDAILMQLLPGWKLDSFTDVGNFADYGLEAPYATVIFHGAGRMHPDTIFVGDKTPTNPSCYVRLGSSDTVLVSREMTHNVVNKNLYHLRDKNFLHIGSDTVDSLRIEGSGRPLTFSRREGWWWVGTPPVRADKQLIDAYLNTLTLAIIRGFPAEDLSALDRFGLERPSKRIFLSSGHREIEISFGDPFEDQIHAVRTGLDKVLLLEQSVLEPFDWTMSDVVSKRLSFFEFDDVVRIIIATPDIQVSMERGPDGWRLGDALVQQAKVQSFLKMLQIVRFESITDRGIGDSTSLPTPPSLKIELEGEGGFTIERILFFRADGIEEKAFSLTSDAFGPVGSGTIQQLARLVEER